MVLSPFGAEDHEEEMEIPMEGITRPAPAMPPGPSGCSFAWRAVIAPDRAWVVPLEPETPAY